MTTLATLLLRDERTDRNDERMKQMFAEFVAWTKDLAKRGILEGVEGLKSEGKTVRRKGAALVIDGPYAEGREAVLGSVTIRVADLDEACRIAGESPFVAYGGALEVHLVNPFPAARASAGINHQVGIKASPDAIYQTLTDTKTLAQWWTTDTRGSASRVGDTIEFWFGTFCQKFMVTALEPGKRVVWTSPLGQGNDEWEGTQVSFELSTDDKQTFVQFRHTRWRDSSTFQGHCSMRWAVFLLSLKDLLERGKGRPVPYDLEVHHR